MKSKSSGLSGGAIAGIVIACVAVIAITVTLILYSRKKSDAPNQSHDSNITKDSINHFRISDKI